MYRLPPPELYAHKQFKHHLGYGLFAPDPGDDYDRVRVGDVGYISHTGGFVRLFNAFHDADSPENRGADIPESFAPISQEFRRVLVDRTLTKGHLVSESVDVVRFDANGTMASSAPGLQVEASVSFRLQCASRTGAVLLLNHAPTREWARSSDAMMDYIVANCMSWFLLVKTQRLPLELHDLIFVRECTLTGDWATVVWDESSFHSEINFNIGINGGPRVGVSFWGEWEDHVTAPKRQGPRRTAEAREAYSMEQFDQCIFLKGIRVALREWYQKLAAILTKWARPEDAGFADYPSNPSAIRLLRKMEFRIDKIGHGNSSFRPVRNASDLIAMFILENSDVDVALVDDNDINSFGLERSESLESICEALFDRHDIKISTFITHDTDPKIVGRLQLSEAVTPGTIGASALVLLDEAYVPVNDQGIRIQDMKISDFMGGLDSYVSGLEMMSDSGLSGTTFMGSEVTLVDSEMSLPGGNSGVEKGKKPNHRKSKGAVRAKAGCYTCRIRRKRCDEKVDSDGSCQTCARLRLQCLGFGTKGPDWMREGNNVQEIREKIKTFLAQSGMIKGHPGTANLHNVLPSTETSLPSALHRKSVVKPPDFIQGSSTGASSFVSEPLITHDLFLDEDDVIIDNTRDPLFPVTRYNPSADRAGKGKMTQH